MDPTLKIMSGAEHMSNIASTDSLRYTKGLIYRLAQMTLCIKVLHNVLPFVRPNIIFRWSNKWVVNTPLSG